MKKPMFLTVLLNALLLVSLSASTAIYLDINPWIDSPHETSPLKYQSYPETGTNQLTGTHHIRTGNGFNSMEIKYDGEIHVSDDDKSIRSISPNGYLKVGYRTFGNKRDGQSVEQITLFYADGRVVYILTGQGREYIVDFKMEVLEEVLDPELFFRINRTFTLHINGIKDVIIHSNSRLKVVLHQAFDKELIVSRGKVNPFKMWFGMR